MKTFTKCLIAMCFAFTSAVGINAATGDGHIGKKTLSKLKGVPRAFAAPKSARPAIPVFGSEKFRDSRYAAPMLAADATPSTVIGPTSIWGVINGPGGTEWLYEQENETVGYGDIVSSRITVYNNLNELVGTVNLTIPDGQKVNDVQVFGQVTNRFFDLNSSSYEITVYINEVIDYNITGRIDVLSLSDGSLVATYPGSTGLYFGYEEGYNTFQRYLFADDVIEDDVQYMDVSVYSPASYSSDTPTLEHTFRIPYENLMYSDGPYVNYYYIDGQPYYVISQYEKPYMDGYDTTTWEPIPATDNHYLVTVYDGNFEQVAQLSIPVETQDGALYTFYTFGYFSYDDMTRGKFTGDDKLNFIVTRYDYLISSDSYNYDILVYDEDGQLVNTIGNDLTMWMKLSDIEGQPEQYALMQTGVENETIQMVDLPSCETVTTFPGVLNGDLLSTSLDRYPKGDSYQYAIALGSGYDDGNGNTITKIGWYNKDLSLDHFVNINLGPKGTFAQHYFMTGSLNPYLFNTDDQHEYILIATMMNDDGYSSTPELCIANDSGELVNVFRGDDEKGTYNYGYLSGALTDHPQLMVGYLDSDWQYTLETYNLPFTKFAGGSGTKADPYIIATPGDLNQMRNAPAAFYALANDLDMTKYYGSFSPVGSFSGGLDGRGHSINNLRINAESMYSGLFSDIAEGDTIKDLTFNDPVINGSSSCFYAGVVAGSFSGDNAAMLNIHVNNATITGDEMFSAEIGGIAGELTYNSTVASSSVNGLTVDAPMASRVGGIVGETRTGATVTASAAGGTITAGDYIGGIVGYIGNDVQVTNCHADFTLTGLNTIGGIAGYSSRGLVDHCYSTGSITATESDVWSGNFNVGGIVGNLSTDWSGGTDPVVSNSLAAVSSITLPEGAEAKAVHRIVGRSVADEDWMEGETPMTEGGLVNNYAVDVMTVNGATLSSSDATTVEGADVNAEESLNDSFFTDVLGFAYGTTLEEPWKSTGSLPVLYFETNSLSIDCTYLEMNPNDEAKLTATVEGGSGENITFTSSDTSVAEIVSVEADGETAVATIRCTGYGSATITVSYGSSTQTCIVTSGATGITTVKSGSKLAIYSDAAGIHAPSAKRITVYTTSGTTVAATAGDCVRTGNLTSGIYVVAATDEAGNTTTAKVVVK